VHERGRHGWVLAKYAYDFFDLAHDGRRGYHWHIISERGREPEHHAHCGHPSEAPAPHYRYIPVAIVEAHSDFVRLYLADRGILCEDLRPLL
jgi:hypothetical protein